jgi:Phytochelatin synthase
VCSVRWADCGSQTRRRPAAASASIPHAGNLVEAQASEAADAASSGWTDRAGRGFYRIRKTQRQVLAAVTLATRFDQAAIFPAMRTVQTCLLHGRKQHVSPAKEASMVRMFARSFLISSCLLATAAASQTLTLPDGLVDLRSHQGAQYLAEARAHEAYLPISTTFETQKNQAYCGIASMVMALNAIQVPAPTSPEYQPYHTFTQDNVLDDRTETILPRATLNRQGTTLDQLGAMLGLHPIKVEVHHAADDSLDEFRKTAADYLATKDHFVIVNYLRKSVGQQIGGHISPLAAYDAAADRFLILDVARYKYPPVWVTASDLFNAMNTTDAVNNNKSRGYVLIAKTDTAPATPTH